MPLPVVPPPPVIAKPEMVVLEPMPLAVTTGHVPVPDSVVPVDPAPASDTPSLIVMSPLKVPGPTLTTSPDAAMFTAF